MSSVCTSDKFRLHHAAEFSARSRRLSMLLKVPLQKAQGVLAQAYGFADLHALQQDRRLAAISPTLYPEGPYSGPLLLAGEADIITARNQRFRRLALEAADPEARDWAYEVPFLAFFEERAHHEEAWAAALARGRPGVGATEAVEPGTGWRQYYREGQFTPLGQAIRDELSLVMQASVGSPEMQQRASFRLDDLVAAHPDNPWVTTYELGELLEPYLQSDWSEFVGRDGAAIHPALPIAQREHAKDLLDCALDVMKTVTPLFGDKLPSVAAAREMGGEAETVLWSALCYCGVIAFNAGDHQRAWKWLSLYYRLNMRDNFGARYFLAALSLNAGKGRMAGYFEADHGGLPAHLYRMAEARRDGRSAVAEGHLLSALRTSPHLIKAVDPRSRPVEGWSGSNHEWLATAQEFFHRTATFWDREAEHYTWLKAVLADRTLRMAYRAFHKARLATVGRALKPREEVRAADEAERVASDVLQQALSGACVKAAGEGVRRGAYRGNLVE